MAGEELLIMWLMMNLELCASEIPTLMSCELWLRLAVYCNIVEILVSDALSVTFYEVHQKVELYIDIDCFWKW